MLHKSRRMPAENPHHYWHNFLDKPSQQHELLFILRNTAEVQWKGVQSFFSQTNEALDSWMRSRPAGIHCSYSIQWSWQMTPFHFPFLHFIVQKKNLSLNQHIYFLLNLFPFSRWYVQEHNINPKQKWATRSKCAISSAQCLMCLFSVDLWSRLTSRIFCFMYHLQSSGRAGTIWNNQWKKFQQGMAMFCLFVFFFLLGTDTGNQNLYLWKRLIRDNIKIITS